MHGPPLKWYQMLLIYIVMIIKKPIDWVRELFKR